MNVYPAASEHDSSYLLNLRITQIKVKDIPDPDQALPPLSKVFPSQQVGYFGPGLDDNTYAGLWTAVFQDLTVRQYINRIAEHMGPRTYWTWAGGREKGCSRSLRAAFSHRGPLVKIKSVSRRLHSNAGLSVIEICRQLTNGFRAATNR